MKKLLCVFLWVTCAYSAPAQTVLLESDLNNWFSTYWNQQWGSYQAFQESSDSTPAPCWRMTFGNSSNFLDEVDMFCFGNDPNMTWDPAVDGPLSYLTFRLQLSAPAPSGNIYMMVEQFGTWYISKRSWPVAGNGSGWNEIKAVEHLRAEDFRDRYALNQTGSNHPDFSANGYPLHFGFMVEVNWIQQGDFYDIRVDDYEVTAIAPTNPAHFAATTHRAGTLAYLSVVNSAPGERVYFTGSLTGLGGGPCIPSLGGVCLDILQPVRFLGVSTTDFQGRADLTAQVPAFVPASTPIYLQAVVENGPSGSSSYATNVVQDQVRP